ncbi:MAG: asparagine synthase-related protein [Alphaproteobacteria bacterium]|nr:asparagine synthase-related protein [Alphaproteobacteria bacterium]
MIGLFGLIGARPDEPVSSAPMAATLAPGYAVARHDGAGASFGRAAHQHDGTGLAVSRDGQRIAVAIGEIFNLAEIAETPSPGNLAEFALHLAQARKWHALARANGLFSFAVYDRTTHRLTLVTDHHASFPLHVWQGGGTIAFAGQIFTLLGHAAIPRKADAAVLPQLFTTQRTFGSGTPVAGVEALPAGCVWEADAQGVRTERYWRLAWRRRDFDLEDGARLLAEALRRAGTRQTSDTNVGLLLSGGLDSRLVLAAAPHGTLSCWTTASYPDNPELAIARATASMFGAEHHQLIVEPAGTLAVLDQTVIDANGLYPASTAMSAFLPDVGRVCHTILTGHGLDFTLRGYYLPARFAEIAGSRTRLPALRPIPARPTGADILNSLRQGPPRATVARIVAPSWRTHWWAGQAETLQEVLAPWLDSDEPYNAWDAFILHALSKHYAFTGMMATRAVGNLRMPSFDAEVFDVYLRMPPAWRCNGKMVKHAIRHLSTDAARMTYANTGFRTDLDPWLEVSALLGRAALRRLGLARRPVLVDRTHSAGSWHDAAALYREDPGHRRRFQEIRQRLDALSFGVLDIDGLAACIDEHLDGRASHAKLMRQLLTHDSWVRNFRIAGSA